MEGKKKIPYIGTNGRRRDRVGRSPRGNTWGIPMPNKFPSQKCYNLQQSRRMRVRNTPRSEKRGRNLPRQQRPGAFIKLDCSWNLRALETWGQHVSVGILPDHILSREKERKENAGCLAAKIHFGDPRTELTQILFISLSNRWKKFTSMYCCEDIVRPSRNIVYV